MKLSVALKLIVRSWWRNKTFAFISIISLAIGIACTNLLMAFVIHEYTIEKGNPNKENILYMTQDSPMELGKTVSYISADIPPLLKDKYPEIEECICMQDQNMEYLTIDNKRHAPILLLNTDSSFLTFFPYKVIAGSIMEALTEPNKLALTETVAKKFFGNESPLGKEIVVHENNSWTNTRKKQAYQVVAILEERDQSFIRFDGLTRKTEAFHGGISLLLQNTPIDKKEFANRLKKDNIPTLQADKGGYHFNTIQNAYFQEFTQENIPYINRRQIRLLYIGFGSAILILCIACFNYVNLSFSRILQQVQTIHTQKLMGASRKEITLQLFADTFLTMLIAFGVSLLITLDLLPIFNSIVGGKLNLSFFFSSQVLPVLVLFILILSVVPSFFLSRKISQLSNSGYKEFFSSRKKERIVGLLSIAQYIISFMLIIATITVNNQVRLIKRGGERYKNLIEIRDNITNESTTFTLAEILRKYPEIQSVSTNNNSALYYWFKQLILKDEQGNETYYTLTEYTGEATILETLQIKQLQGLTPEEALQTYAYPVYINQRFAEILIPQGENPIGKPLKMYEPTLNENKTSQQSSENTETIIAGIVENMYTNSFEETAPPYVIHITNKQDSPFPYLQILIGENRKKAMATIQENWERLNLGGYFTYLDCYETFMERNKKAIELSNLLLMYSIISIILTGFGLFGMARYTTEHRTKEIGIRKVNGANSMEVMLLLNKRFIKWIIIAFVISTPIAWILLNKWLENFAYKTSLSFSTVLISLILVCIITLITVSGYTYKAASRNPIKALRKE